MGILCTFFSQEELRTNRMERHYHFEVIFCGREGEAVLHEIRISFLIRLSVMAIQYPVYGLFEDIAQWLFKIGSGKPYAERVVGELVDKFVLVPDKYQMHEYLVPLREKAPPFALIFLVHSINEHTAGVSLMSVLGEWLSVALHDFLDSFAEHSQLAEKFCSQKFDCLLRYDMENGREDGVHHRLHFCLTSLLLEWRLSARHKLNCASLLETLLDFPTLPGVGRERVLDNTENALRSGHIPAREVQAKLPEEVTRLPEFTPRFSMFFS